MRAPSPAQLQAAVRDLETTAARAERSVYLTCRTDMERTATVLIAYYARRRGVGYDEALKALRRQRPILRPLPEQERATRSFVATEQV